MRKSGSILLLLLVVGSVALAIAMLPRENNSDSSPFGSKGLQVWLEAHGIAVMRSDEHVMRARPEMSLRILSLPMSSGEAGGNDPSEWMREAARYGLPTLIVMPKWRGSVSGDGMVRESDLLPLRKIQDALDLMKQPMMRLNRNGPPFEETLPQLDWPAPVRIALYHEQAFDRAGLPYDCRQLFGTRTGALLVRCDSNRSVYFLSDPDLLNNHGLALAENATFALTLIAQLRGPDEKRPVYLDASGQSLDGVKADDEGRSYERSSSDFRKFFTYPLSVVWGALLVVVAICFWRGAYRFGPPQSDASEATELSKAAAIDATARLLRLSGNDGRMTAQFVQHLLADKAQMLFGKGAGNPAGIERMLQRLARRDQQTAQALKAVSQALIERGHAMGRSDLHRNLEIFRKLLGSIELGTR